MNKIKVLIVDDSAFMRKILTDILQEDQNIIVVEKAKNGKEAVEKLKQNNVDVITMDVEMPIMNGIETLKQVMKVKPTPIVMLSSLTKEGADLTMEALNEGAVDFITKPTNIFKIDKDEIKKEILDKIKIASKAKLKLKQNIAVKEPVIQSKEVIQTRTVSYSKTVDSIVAIGTSTGGPKALQQVIPKISANINAPIVIVQHMPPGFTKSLATRLDSISGITVKEAENGEFLKNGWAYIAPGDRHLKFKQDSSGIKIILDDSENVSGHKPSVDAMFFSLEDIAIRNFLLVIMTGMGKDGALGMKKMKEKTNVFSIAESEETCVVFGMPKSAIALNAVDKVVNLEKIALEINNFMGV